MLWLHYYQTIESPIGKVSEIYHVIRKMFKDRRIIDDTSDRYLSPVYAKTLKLIFPPVFLSRLADVSYWREADSWAPEHIDGQIEIDDGITKTEVFTRGNVVYKKEHILEIFQTMPFVCGFIEHHNQSLQNWRKYESF